LVDTDYHELRSVEIDVAVLVMGEVVPGPSARLGTEFPTGGDVTLAGLQPVDTDGTLLRGDGPHDLPRPAGATDDVITYVNRPAGCVEAVTSLEVQPHRVTVHCGLIPSSSGGGLFAEQDGEPVLIGVLSTVSADISKNGVVPLSSLHELLDNQDEYRHPVTSERTQRERHVAVLT
jgi:hypothetical protein